MTFFVPDVASVDLGQLGPQFEHHPLYPQRANVEFVQVVSDSEIILRIWERGTGPTLASGSCSCAAVVAAASAAARGPIAVVDEFEDDAADIDEERRLLYVAMTRAKSHLHLLVPQRFYVTQQTPYGDRHLYAGRSRFITDAMLGQFEQCVWPRAAASGQGMGAQSSEPVMQVRQRALSAWR